jgi:hypothetical protein
LTVALGVEAGGNGFSTLCPESDELIESMRWIKEPTANARPPRYLGMPLLKTAARGVDLLHWSWMCMLNLHFNTQSSPA